MGLFSGLFGGGKSYTESELRRIAQIEEDKVEDATALELQGNEIMANLAGDQAPGYDISLFRAGRFAIG